MGDNMENTIWKRFGGWIKGNKYARVGDEVNNVDAEGMLVEMSDGNDDPVTKRRLGLSPISAVEDGFAKLTDVIREMNSNVTMHREQAADLNQKVTALAEQLPEGLLKQNTALCELSEQLKIQALRYEQVSELLKTLPENSENQLEHLAKISEAMESSMENQASQTEAFRQFNTTVQSVSESGQAQAASLANIGQMLEANEKHLQNMIEIQNKRFGKLYVTTIFLTVAAIGSVAAVLWLVMQLKNGVN